MKGPGRYYSADDLDRVVDSYKPGQVEAPLVLGHPKTDEPAYGWVRQLRRVGDYLQARFDLVSDEIKSAVRQGAYKYFSISLGPEGTLRHVGLLGAASPAVTGLGAADLEEESEIFSFAMGEFAMDGVTGVEQGLLGSHEGSGDQMEGRHLTQEEAEEVIRNISDVQERLFSELERLKLRLKEHGVSFAQSSASGSGESHDLHVDLTQKV